VAATSLSTREIAAELAPFGVELSEPALAQLSTYLELLLRWNRRVNLTGLRQPRHIVRRLFGESLYLSRLVELRGWLVDVGSGAGFPGLALKLVAPDLRVTLIEARQRKCAFVKEVVRECGFYAIDVVTERFERWREGRHGQEMVDLITTRAVRTDRKLLERVGKTVAFLETIKPAQVDGSEDRTVTWKIRDKDFSMQGLPYLSNWVLPNVCFHVTTAYAILRHNGVELGKADFLGPT